MGCIDALTDQRMPKFFEVQSYLVLPARVEAQFEQGRAVQALADSVVRCGIEACLVVVHKLASSVAIARRNARLDRAAGRIGDALDERQVMAVEPVLLEQLAAGGMGVLGERHRQRS